MRNKNPSISALMTHALGSDRIMPYVTFGGTNPTMDLVSPTNINRDKIAAIEELAYNESISMDDTGKTFFSRDVKDLLSGAKIRRRERIIQE